MTRICVIGNSHVAAIKLGWDALVAAHDPLTEALTPTFFGAPSDGVRHIRLQDGALVPKRKDIAEHFQRMGGADRIRLAEFDAFLLIGLSVSIKRILRFYKSHAWVGLKGVEGKVLVHPAFARDHLAERYSETILGHTARMIRQGSDRPILAMAEPHWAEWIRHGAPDTPEYGWDRAILAGDGAEMAAMFAASVADSLAGHALFLPQPPHTVAEGITTAAAFNKDASRLITGEGGGTDAAHMNAGFGQAIWQAVPGLLA